MDTNRLTKTQNMLIYGLKQFKISKENRVSIALFLESEEDQILMIDFLIHNQEATEQEILKAVRNILIRRKKLTDSSSN